MNAPEPGALDVRSSVKLTRNAKGDTQIEVKVRAGDDPRDIEGMEQDAMAIYDRLVAKYRLGAA